MAIEVWIKYALRKRAFSSAILLSSAQFLPYINLRRKSAPVDRDNCILARGA